MTPAIAEILEKVKRLSVSEQADLADWLAIKIAHEAPPEIAALQLEEVQRRIREVEAGAVKLIPGDEALAEVRGLLASLRESPSRKE